MIKKKGDLFVSYILIIFLASMFLFSAVLADGNSSVSNASNSQTVTSESTNRSKVDLAFDCLVTELKPDCSGATTIQQLAFSILASPDNITGKCVNLLLSKRKDNQCFGDGSSCGIKETAWAILALNHVGKNTSAEISWLTKQNKTSSDVEWFLQQDSVGEANCKLRYSGEDHSFNAKENKKLAGNIGPCFSFAQSNYWLRLDEGCFDKEFLLTCDKEFFAGWHYKSLGSSVLNVLSETKKTAANQEVKLMVNSKCFGSGSGCNFEDTAWAVIALKDQLIDIKPYIPYLISAEDSNTQYLSTALNYLVLEYSSLYGTKLLQQQKSGAYWEADYSEYGSIYDTALALLAIGKQNHEQIAAAKDWIWFKQDANHCWNSRNVRDTAFLLWAIEQRPAKTDSEIVIAPTTKCEEGGFVCSKQLDCMSINGEVLTSYDCSHKGFSQVCCSKNPVKSCDDLLGEVCKGDLVCSGLPKQSLEGDCCLDECIVREEVSTECEDMEYTCKTSCSASQEEADFSCGSSGKICCAKKTDDDSKGVPLWVWLLIAILILLLIIVIIFRDRIKVWYYKKKKGSSNNPGATQENKPMPPRPGFPPLVRPTGRPMQPYPPRRPLPNTNRATQQRPPQQQDTFAKLKQMTK